MQDAFFDHPVIRKIKAVVDAKLNFEHQIELVDNQFKILFSTTRQTAFTATFTAKRGKPPFAQIIRSLAEALQGERGSVLHSLCIRVIH